MSGLIPYEPGIPASSHNPSNDQPLMQQNNDAASQIWAVDHVGFNTNYSGCHNWSTYIDQGSTPLPIAPANQLRVFSQAVSGTSQLFYQRDNNATAIPLTGPSSAATSGYTYLPGGFIIQWNTLSIGGSPTTWNFPIAFPNNCFSVQATRNVTSGNIYPFNVGPLGNSSVTIYGGPGTAYLLAIGN